MSLVTHTSPHVYRGTPLESLDTESYPAWHTQFIQQARSVGFANFYLDSNYKPPDLVETVLNDAKHAAEAHRYSNPVLYEIESNLSEDERKLREQEITELRDSIIADKLTIKSAAALVKLKAEAHLFLISALSSKVIQELPSDSDPYAYYRLVVTRFENHPSRKDPATILRAERSVSWNADIPTEMAMNILLEHQSNFRNAMQPSDWDSLSSEAYATRFWNYESVWTVLHNLITAAQKYGGTVPTPAQVQAKVVECLRSATLRSSNYGTPAS
ncbi:unnamed protein product, partial [Aphanomyces euteiches]